MKNRYVKAVAGSTLAVSLLVAPALATSGGPALAAPYNTSVATSTSVSPDGPFAEYGSQPTVTATVTSTGWTVVQTGDVRFVVTYVRNNKTRLLEDIDLPLSSTGTATYTFPANADANQTYRVAATYSGDDYYNGSTAPVAANVTIYLRSTTTTIGTISGPEQDGSGSATFTVPVTVSAEYGTPGGDVVVECAYPDGEDGFFYEEGYATLESGAAVLTCTVPGGTTVMITATYYGEPDAYDTSTTSDNPVTVNS